MTHYTSIEIALHSQPGVRRLVGGWLLLALLALALSTGFAVLLVASRTPISGGFVASVGLFRSALVLHVGLAVVVWFLSCAAALWCLAAGGVPGHTRWAALALAYAGVLALLGALFSRSTAPVLANYIPVLDSPVFLLGLVWFLGGVALCGATSIGGVLSHVKKNPTAWRVAALLSIGVTAIALLALAIPVAQSGVPTDAMQFELLAWGPGHILQFAHVLLLMGVWNVLGEQALGRAVASRSFMVGQLLLAALPVLASPGVYVAYPIDSTEFRRAFTLLMAWGSWPAAVLLGGCLLVQLLRAGRGVWMALHNLPLLLSIFLFLMGCVCGAAIRGESTMVPAHYHGTVGAVTMAYMALGYRLLPAFGFAQRRGRLERWQPALYGAGLIILAASLAWSGWLGVPRKTLHVEIGMQSPAYFAAMGLVGLGGFLAVSGAALFVFNIVCVLRTERAPTVRVSGTPPWPQTVGLSAAFALCSGTLFAYMPDLVGKSQVSAAQDAVRHTEQKRKDEIDRQFAEGVAMLSAREYQAAASALRRVLELAPRMPEAHVNLGFAMIGLQKPETARDFFEMALSLRTTQMNAYYGLAIALEMTGDFEGALGAMRTYVHRSKPDDPFMRKANAAIWEWETQLAKTRLNNIPQTLAITSIPENGKNYIRYPIVEKTFN